MFLFVSFVNKGEQSQTTVIQAEIAEEIQEKLFPGVRLPRWCSLDLLSIVAILLEAVLH